MICKAIPLDIPYQQAGACHDDFQAVLHTYIQDKSDLVRVSESRPAVILCPGGGYVFTCDREAEPVALKYAAMGYHVFVLRYSVAPNTFPSAQLELAKSIAIVREHAEEWGVNPNQIIVTGFSAGGHLSASLCCYWDKEFLYGPLGLTAEDIKPNGAILCYPVITSGEFAHRDSFVRVSGDRYDELVDFLSLEHQVGPQVPPTFIWHTVTDDLVPFENTLFYINALQKHHISFEAHIYPEGKHGVGLAEVIASEADWQVQEKLQSWMPLAKTWLANHFPFIY